MRTRTNRQKSRDSEETLAVSVGHVSERQVMALMAFLLGLKALLITPTFLIVRLTTAAWISVLISLALGFAGLEGWLRWSRLTAGMDAYMALKKTLGSILGTVISMTIFFGFLLANSYSIRLFAGGAVIGLLPEFPIEILLVTVIASSAYAAWLGLENVARGATFFLVPTAVSFIIVILTGLKGFDARNLMPIFGTGPGKVAVEGVKLAGLWGALPAFMALKTYVRRESELASGTRKGLLLAGLALTAVIITILLFFPYPASTKLAHPMGILARSVYIGRFLQRVEAIFIFTWYFASALQASFTFFILMSIISQLANTQTYRPFLPALASLTFGVAAIPISTLRAGQLLSKYFFEALGNLFVVLGWVLYLIAKQRGVEPVSQTGAQGGETRGTESQGSGGAKAGQGGAETAAPDSGGMRHGDDPVSGDGGVLGKKRD